MNIFRIKVDLLFLTWEELSQQELGKELIMYNRQKPWNGFTIITIENIGKEHMNVIAPRSTAFNHFSISKKEYEIDYFITDNLMWHRLSETTQELKYNDIVK